MKKLIISAIAFLLTTQVTIQAQAYDIATLPIIIGTQDTYHPVFGATRQYFDGMTKGISRGEPLSFLMLIASPIVLLLTLTDEKGNQIQVTPSDETLQVQGFSNAEIANFHIDTTKIIIPALTGATGGQLKTYGDFLKRIQSIGVSNSTLEIYGAVSPIE